MTQDIGLDDLVVDDRGLLLSPSHDAPLDVLFDGQRVFSFWSVRDTVDEAGQRRMAWPPLLHRFLDGEVTVTVTDPVTGDSLGQAHARLGTGEGTVRVCDREGNPLGLDKNFRLTKLFADRQATQMVPLLDAMEVVLAALETAGVEPFLAYGTLLGAVRDQDFIGHDSDADLGYVSRFDHPVDVIRESMELQRSLQHMGFAIQRYSGLGFKVTVREADGSRRGLDVFGGFMRAGTLYLMGEVGEPFDPSWLHPRSEVQLAGRSFPAPAEPARLLTAMYGASWQVPDPAFRFETPAGAVRRLDGWFRGTRPGFDDRWQDHRAGVDRTMSARPSTFVRWARRSQREASLFVDVGCGRSKDPMWLARQGCEVVGLDYFPRDLLQAERRAARRGLDVDYQWCNLAELRSALVTGADLVRRTGPRVVLAHHVLDATTRRARRNALLLARMVVRAEGTFFVQTYAEPTELSSVKRLSPVPTDELFELVAESGGHVVSHDRLTEQQAGFTNAPAAAGAPTIDRTAISWNR